jgi:hypothetical protein
MLLGDIAKVNGVDDPNFQQLIVSVTLGYTTSSEEWPPYSCSVPDIYPARSAALQLWSHNLRDKICGDELITSRTSAHPLSSQPLTAFLVTRKPGEAQQSTSQAISAVSAMADRVSHW